jgi:hypothetical protein
VEDKNVTENFRTFLHMENAGGILHGTPNIQEMFVGFLSLFRHMPAYYFHYVTTASFQILSNYLFIIHWNIRQYMLYITAWC